MKSGTAETDEPGYTVDAFHRGAFHLAQPARGGHRAGLDAMLLAGAVPSGFAGALADLGAGAGAAGLAVSSRCRQARVTLVERDPLMADFARQTLTLPDNSEIAPRATVIEADVTLTGNARRDAGLGDRAFDFAIMNPPFNAAQDRASPDPLRRDAHVMDVGTFEAWLRTAAAILKPGGGVALIARPNALHDILTAAGRRFGGVAIVPILPHEDSAAIRVIAIATRGSRAGLALLPSLVLHERGGHALTPRAEAICNGEAALLGD